MLKRTANNPFEAGLVPRALSFVTKSDDGLQLEVLRRQGTLE